MTRSGRRIVSAPLARRFGPYGSLQQFLEKYLFNPDFYLAQLGDRSLRRSQAWKHFVEQGQHEGLNPSPFVDICFAREVAAARGGNREHGLFDLASTWGSNVALSPMFDSTHYLLRYHDVRVSGLDPYFHWVSYGIFEGRAPSPGIEFPKLVIDDFEETTRRAAIQAVLSVRDLIKRQRDKASLNLEALAVAYPHVDPFRGLVLGEIPFSQDPHAIFGDVTLALIANPDATLALKARDEA